MFYQIAPLEPPASFYMLELQIPIDFKSVIRLELSHTLLPIKSVHLKRSLEPSGLMACLSPWANSESLPQNWGRGQWTTSLGVTLLLYEQDAQ